MSEMDPALAEVVQLLGHQGKQALLSSLRSRDTLEHFVHSEQPHLPDLDQLMPLMDALGVKRGKLMSEGLRKMIQYLAGKSFFRKAQRPNNSDASDSQAKWTSCLQQMQAICLQFVSHCCLTSQS